VKVVDLECNSNETLVWVPDEEHECENLPVCDADSDLVWIPDYPGQEPPECKLKVEPVKPNPDVPEEQCEEGEQLVFIPESEQKECVTLPTCEAGAELIWVEEDGKHVPTCETPGGNDDEEECPPGQELLPDSLAPSGYSCQAPKPNTTCDKKELE